MADTATNSAPTAPPTAFKPSHPKTFEMVTAAIKNLKKRGGSWLQAIKKYISANCMVDAEKLAPFIKKYLKAAVTTGSLVQTEGKGASGSFKLSADKKSSVRKPCGTKQKATKPAAASKKPKKATSAAVKKPASATKKASKPKASKSSSKVKKAATVPTKKPKAPKPKKAAVKAKSPKKVAAQKRK